MTLPPGKIGDKGQRYVVYWTMEGEEKPMAYSDRADTAAAMVKAAKLHPSCSSARIEDRRMPKG